MEPADHGRATPDDFALIADSAPVPMWVTSPDRTRAFVNRAYAAFLGVDYATALTFDWRTIIHPDDAARVHRQSLEGEASLHTFTLEGRYRRGDGAWRWLRSVSQPRWDAAGDPVGFIGVAHDVTDAKEAQLRLQLRERQLSALVEQTAAGLSQVDADGRLTFVNDRFCAITGRTRDALLGAPLIDLMHADDVSRHAALFDAAIRQGVPYSVEIRFLRPDGATVSVDTVVTVMRDHAGGRNSALVVSIDVTARRAAEAALRRGEASVRLAIESAGMATWELDLATMEGAWSTNRFELLGYPPAASGRGRYADWLARVHPDDVERARRTIEACFAHGGAFTMDYRILRADTGACRWLQSHGSRVEATADAAARFVGVSFDITAAHAAAEATLESERRLRFLDRLGTATAAATDPDDILRITTGLLGEELAVSDCAYADMEADEDAFHIRGDWHDATMRSIVGTYSLATFGSQAVGELHAGRPLIVRDAVGELGDDGSAAFLGLGARATICMPLVKQGRLTALMAIHDAQPRDWTQAELRLLREVTERSWAHIERVRAEAALRESEATLRLAIEGAQIGTWDWDLIAAAGRWSPRAAAIMGVADGVPITSERPYGLVHPDDRTRLQAAVTRAIERGEVLSTEYRILRPDGEVRWVASRGVVTRDAEGVAVRLTGTLRDVTNRRRAQEALEALNRTLGQRVAERTAERDRMWRLSSDLLLVVDARWRIRAANPASEALLGIAPDALVGQRVKRFVHPDDWPDVHAMLRLGKRAPVVDFAARLVAHDGRIRHFSWSAAPGDGEAYVIGRDNSAEVRRREQLEQAQEALRQSQKVESLGQLTGGVAHDFNNLLTPIIGNLDLLRRRVPGGREQRLLNAAAEAAERARTLIQRLLAFARRQPLQPGPVDIAALVEGMAELIASTCGPQIAVALSLDAGLPPARADLNQLEMALLNLSVNARDAMPDGGKLTIAATLAEIAAGHPTRLPPGRFVRVAVGDTGIGMDAATLARAIEPFFSTKGVGKGTGLGLSMVHGLASQLGGAMLVDSAPGVGTDVALFLPLAVAQEHDHAPARPATPAGPRGGVILLVDDEPAVRAATRDLLVDLGYTVVEADSAADALRAIPALAPDLLVTDHLMPGMTGAELAREVSARYPAIKVLLVSGYAALDTLPPDLTRLPKPFRQRDLADALARL